MTFPHHDPDFDWKDEGLFVPAQPALHITPEQLLVAVDRLQTRLKLATDALEKIKSGWLMEGLAMQNVAKQALLEIDGP